jgi:hypothetical protein
LRWRANTPTIAYLSRRQRRIPIQTLRCSSVGFRGRREGGRQRRPGSSNIWVETHLRLVRDFSGHDEPADDAMQSIWAVAVKETRALLESGRA